MKNSKKPKFSCFFNKIYVYPGGLIALEKLSQVMPETHNFSFVNKFLSVTFQQFQINNEGSIHKKAAEVFGKLLRLGGFYYLTYFSKISNKNKF